MGKINVMSPHLANMIAAGEVVEGPQSIIKELIENSIDANSKNITIYLKNSGLDSIKVIDDGDGMDSEDVEKAFLPHATSKIKNEYDLFRIKTLGFRGEAIASIASVSNMSITSSTDGIGGFIVRYKNGVRQEGHIINANKGTTIIVEELFYNTPARLKHLKAPNKELSSIIFFVNKIALSNPNIRITLYNDDKVIIQTIGDGKLESLILKIYGIEAAKNIITKDYTANGYKCKLLFIKPVCYRSTKNEITLIFNGRYVKNYNLTNMISEAYLHFLPINKYPVGVCYFEVDPLLIDCNIHPSKAIIKISDEDLMAKRLKEELYSLISSETLIYNRNIEEKKSYEKQNIFTDYNVNLYKKEDNELNDNILVNKTINTYDSNINLDKPYISNDNLSNRVNPFDSYKNVKKEDPIIEKKDKKVEEIDITPDAQSIEMDKKLPVMQYIGEIFGIYLIFQGKDSMYLVDQHAAAERINYEYYYDLLSKNSNIKIDLIVPSYVSFTKNEALYILDNLNEFEKIGFSLDQASETDFIIRSIPLWLKMDNIDSVIYDILELLVSNHSIDVMKYRDTICKQIACKASIKANHHINIDEVNSLIKRLNECKNPYTCPHGRPTIIRLKEDDLEKMFERIQS